MKSLWDDNEASAQSNDPLVLRVYTSNLIGQDENLVLHGGGNTSVKATRKNLFGEEEEILFVKGSGWDLANIKPEGFSPLKLQMVQRLAELEVLSDSDMVRELKTALINPQAPPPSVEAILHALIPYQFVDHSHADVVVMLCNVIRSEQKLQEVFGPRVLFIPYVMPGFILARKVYEQTRDLHWKDYDALILMHHGIFTFADSARQSYEYMIDYVSKAENFAAQEGAFEKIAAKTLTNLTHDDYLQLAPCCKNSSAQALPMPLAAPVTNATCP